MNSSLLAERAPLNFQEFIAFLKVSPRTGRRLLSKVGFSRVGDLVRVPRENVEAYLASRYVPPTEPAPPRRRATGQLLAELVDSAAKRVRERSR